MARPEKSLHFLVEQEQFLDNFVEDWKPGAEQVNDILVIGIRV